MLDEWREETFREKGVRPTRCIHHFIPGSKALDIKANEKRGGRTLAIVGIPSEISVLTDSACSKYLGNGSSHISFPKRKKGKHHHFEQSPKPNGWICCWATLSSSYFARALMLDSGTVLSNKWQEWPVRNVLLIRVILSVLMVKRNKKRKNSRMVKEAPTRESSTSRKCEKSVTRVNTKRNRAMGSCRPDWYNKLFNKIVYLSSFTGHRLFYFWYGPTLSFLWFFQSLHTKTEKRGDKSDSEMKWWWLHSHTLNGLRFKVGRGGEEQFITVDSVIIYRVSWPFVLVNWPLASHFTIFLFSLSFSNIFQTKQNRLTHTHTEKWFGCVWSKRGLGFSYFSLVTFNTFQIKRKGNKKKNM